MQWHSPRRHSWALQPMSCIALGLKRRTTVCRISLAAFVPSCMSLLAMASCPFVQNFHARVQACAAMEVVSYPRVTSLRISSHRIAICRSLVSSYKRAATRWSSREANIDACLPAEVRACDTLSTVELIASIAERCFGERLAPAGL